MSKKENNRVSVNTFEKYYKAYRSDVKTIIIGEGDTKMEVEVKPMLGLSDYGGAVKSAAEGCFSDGKYLAYLHDFMVRHSIIAFYTNIALPSNIEDEFYFLMGTDVFDRVVNQIDPVQLGRLVTDIDEQIDAIADEYNTARAIELDQALAVMKSINAKYQELINLGQSIAGDDLKNLAQKLIEMSKQVQDNVVEAGEMFKSGAAHATGEKTGGDEPGEGM